MFSASLLTMKNDERMIKEGAGFAWERRSRLNLTHHIGLWDGVKLVVPFVRKGKMFEDKYKEFAKEANRDCRKE